jgi:hypothetical protein
MDARLPDGWIIDTSVVSNSMKALLYDYHHFDVPLTQFGITEPKSDLLHPPTAAVSIRGCAHPTEFILNWESPCAELAIMENATRQGAGFNVVNSSGTQSLDGIVFGYGRFWPTDHSYIGHCYGVEWNRMTAWSELKASSRSFCRIFVPDRPRKRGLYIVVPGGALKAVPQLVRAVSFLLQDQWAGCALQWTNLKNKP